ncbi:hypothetical protein COO60DRAFT_1702602, partial [Scenedesmus sp. NREL 46B-D3]
MAAERVGQAAAAALQRPESPQGAPPATANCNSADGIAASGHGLAVEVAASNSEGNVNGLRSPFAADEQQNKSSGTPQQKAAQGVPASNPTASSPKQKQQRRVAKRPSADSNYLQQAANEPAAGAETAADIEEGDQTETMQAVKRRKPAAAAAATAPEQQAHKQHPPDRSHVRQHHAVDGDDEDGLQKPTAPGSPEIEPSGVAAAAAAVPAGSPQQQGRQPQHHKRSKGQPKQLLSFTEEEDADEAAGAPSPAAAAAAAAADSSSQEQQLAAKQAHGSIARATATRFAQEATAQAAAAARTMFRPSGSAAGGAAGGGAAGAAGAVLVDEDEDPRAAARAAAAAGLSQIHFGFATARGHRPYMEDRHTIITALNPATAQQAAAALEAAERPQAAAAAAAAGDDSATAANGSGRQQQHASVAHDGVGRSYAAIFDGHNGAGAAETAARKLHLLLASHPALRLYRGETGPPAVVKQEEAAVGSALKQAFRQVDDMVLSTARHEGTRDGATALVLLRLGNVLYSAHA